MGSNSAKLESVTEATFDATEVVLCATNPEITDVDHPDYGKYYLWIEEKNTVFDDLVLTFRVMGLLFEFQTDLTYTALSNEFTVEF